MLFRGDKYIIFVQMEISCVIYSIRNHRLNHITYSVADLDGGHG